MGHDAACTQLVRTSSSSSSRQEHSPGFSARVPIRRRRIPPTDAGRAPKPDCLRRCDASGLLAPRAPQQRRETLCIEYKNSHINITLCLLQAVDCHSSVVDAPFDSPSKRRNYCKNSSESRGTGPWDPHTTKRRQRARVRTHAPSWTLAT